MLGSTVLDVVIGLLFVFFVFSLLVSGINEGVRKLLNTRSKVLWGSVRKLLAAPVADPRTSLNPRLPAVPPREDPGGSAPSGTPATNGNAADDGWLFDQLFNHPLIAKLDPALEGKLTRISHIPPREFARAMVDILAPRDDAGSPVWGDIEARVAELPATVRSQLQILLEEAEGSIREFRGAVEGWFDSSMARVSDWYKKRTRKAMAAYGLLVAAFFNVSAVVVTMDLYEDEIVRDAVVTLADAQVAEDAPGGGPESCTDRECIEADVAALVETRLPVLWRQCEADGKTVWCGFESGGRWVATIVGWIVTAAALSMGASFWFALLRKAFRVRERIQT
jgi:hypothetical protein